MDDINIMGDAELIDALIEAAEDVVYALHRWDEEGAEEMKQFVNNFKDELLKRLRTKEEVG